MDKIEIRTFNDYVLVASALRHVGATDAEELVLEAATRSYPEQIWAFIHYANVAMRRTAWDEAARRWHALIKRFPMEPMSYTAAAGGLKHCGRAADAESVLASGLNALHLEPSLLREYANVGLELGRDPAEMIKRWHAMREKVPEASLSYVEEARLLTQAGFVDDARRLLGAGLVATNGDLTLLQSTFDLEVAIGNWHEAKTLFERLPAEFVSSQSFEISLRRCFHAAAKAPTEADTLIEKIIETLITSAVHISEDKLADIPLLKCLRELREINPVLLASVRRSVQAYANRTIDVASPATMFSFAALGIEHPSLREEYIAQLFIRIDLRTLFWVFRTENPGSEKMFTAIIGLITRETGILTPTLMKKLIIFAAAIGGDTLAEACSLCIRELRAQSNELLSGEFVETIATCERLRLGSTARPTKLTLLERRLRIGVCVSGQMRGYQTVKPTWEALNQDGHQLSYFVHTWNSLGRRVPGMPYHAERAFSGALRTAFSIAFAELGSSAIRKRFPRLMASFLTSTPVESGHLAETYQSDYIVVEDESSERFLGWSNQQKMLYKIESCFRLAKESGLEFDLIIRIRPDKEIRSKKFDWGKAIGVLSSQTCVFVDQPFIPRDLEGQTMPFQESWGFFVHPELGLCTGDQFALGLFEEMEIYSNSYSWYMKNLAERHSLLRPGFPQHEVQAISMLSQGVRAKSIWPNSVGELRDPPPLSALEVRACLMEDVANEKYDRVSASLIQACEEDISKATL